MLKGVNHHIIEIRQTDDPYFERALLFVRASCASMSDEEQRLHGQALLARAHAHTGLRRARWRRYVYTGLCVFGGAISGVLLVALWSKIG